MSRFRLEFRFAPTRAFGASDTPSCSEFEFRAELDWIIVTAPMLHRQFLTHVTKRGCRLPAARCWFSVRYGGRSRSQRTHKGRGPRRIEAECKRLPVLEVRAGTAVEVRRAGTEPTTGVRRGSRLLQPRGLRLGGRPSGLRSAALPTRTARHQSAGLVAPTGGSNHMVMVPLAKLGSSRDNARKRTCRLSVPMRLEKIHRMYGSPGSGLDQSPEVACGSTDPGRQAEAVLQDLVRFVGPAWSRKRAEKNHADRERVLERLRKRLLKLERETLATAAELTVWNGRAALAGSLISWSRPRVLGPNREIGSSDCTLHRGESCKQRHSSSLSASIDEKDEALPRVHSLT